MLGHMTANIEMTRGGREGTNALLHHEHSCDLQLSSQIQTFLEKNSGIYPSSIVHAVRFGHRKLAGRLIQTYSSYNFNDLHIQTLLNDSQPLKKFKPVSVLKKGQMNYSITPIHTAAINPNIAYLKALIAVEPNFNIPDAQNWFTIHYAAVCEGTGPLKLLLDKGTPVALLNKAKDLPLHCAARAGRTENVKLLLEAIHKAREEAAAQEEHDAEGSQAETEDEGNGNETGPAPKKSRMAKVKGHSSLVNAKAQNGMTPLHMAAEKGHEEVVRVLLTDHDIDVEAQTSAADKKLTPLMLASRMGFKTIADLLIDEGGAVVEKGDKLKRTALIHAVMNGQNHVVAMLLRRGASPCIPDSSGNTPAHYAAAYGWMECLEILARADSSCLATRNDWHLTPLAVAYLKGHVGIVEWLMDGPYAEKVTVNCRDQAGTSLVSSLIDCYAYISSNNIVRQLEYLTSKGADCSLKDTAMNTPLHHFASKNAIFKIENGKRTDFDADDNGCRLTKDDYRRCVNLILRGNAKLLDRNEAGDCPFHVALKSGNLFLAEYLLNKMHDEGVSLRSLGEKTTTDSNTGNILHWLLELPFKVYEDTNIWAGHLGPIDDQYNILPMLKKFISFDSAQVIAWLNEKDSNGRTPIVLLCQKYTTANAAQFNISGEEQRKTCNVYFEDFLYAICSVVKTLAELYGDILLQRFEGNGKKQMDKTHETCQRSENDDSEECKESDASFADDDESSEEIQRKTQHVNVISYGLLGNDGHHRIATSFSVREKEYKIKNKLLITMVEAAKERNLLDKLLSQRDADDYTPLLYTVVHGDADTSFYLMQQQQSIDADTINRTYDERKKKYVQCNKTVLMCALEKQLFEVVYELNLTRDQWNAATLDGNNAFHFAAHMISSKTVECFDLLKEKSVDVKANALGQYPLHIAVDAIRDGGADVLTEPVEWLIQNGPGIHSQDSLGRLPLHNAFVRIGDNDLDDTSSIDPIAVVSVLAQAMDKEKANIDMPDSFGNTPLHYAAQRGSNVCIVTLLGYGYDVDRINNEGNTSLGIAALHQKEACTLTLIQAKSNVIVDVISRKKPGKAKNESWIWIPNRSQTEVLVKKSSVASLVVRNGWQGIIYVILDAIGKNERTLGELLCSALEYRTYNLAHTLLRMLNRVVHTGSAQSIARRMAVVDNLNIFEIFVKNLTSTTMDDNITKIFDDLLSTGIKWYSRDNEGQLKSASIEHLARHGHFALLHALRKRCTDSVDPTSDLIKFTLGNENPLVGIIECWIQSGSSEDMKIWLRTFSKRFGINTLMTYERPAFDGMNPWMSRRPEPRYCRMTPLIRAIQARCVPLVRHADEFGITPLMHACIVNSEPIVRLLFDPSCTRKTIANEQDMSQTRKVLLGARYKRKTKRTNGIGGLFGGFGSALSNNVPSRSSSESVEEVETNASLGRNDVIKLNSDLDLKRSVCKGDQQKAFAADDFNDANFLHFMLRPCAWENVNLLNAISEGVPAVVEMINPANSRDETPLMTAKRLCQARMLSAMKKISKATNADIEMATVDISNIMVRHDVKADSERFIARDTEAKAEAAKKDAAKARRKPSRNSGYQDTGEVCVTKFNESDEEILYKVLLTKTDVMCGQFGFHNFYRMELIQRKGSGLYILFTNWGRIGDTDGQFQHTPFSSFDEAEKEFCSIFHSKTGNHFQKIANFRELSNKYRLVKVDPNVAIDVSDIEIELDSPQAKENAKNDAVYRFIRDVSNVKRLQQKTRTVRFARARKVLQKLDALLKEMEMVRRDSKSVDEVLRVARQQAEATNHFYRLIPLGGFENGSLPVIDNETYVKDYEEMVENLLEFEIAGRIITAAAEMRSTIDPYLYIMNAIECELTLMNSEDMMSQRILHYIHNSSSCRVRAIYNVKSKEATQLFNENALRRDNHRYLWHGTKPENILSILKLGLLATPASAVQTGQSFGKVALGTIANSEVLAEERSAGNMGPKKTSYDTLQVVGLQYPDPHYNITMENGAVMPLGPIKQRTAQEFYDERGYYNYVERSEYVLKCLFDIGLVCYFTLLISAVFGKFAFFKSFMKVVLMDEESSLQLVINFPIVLLSLYLNRSNCCSRFHFPEKLCDFVLLDAFFSFFTTISYGV
ncbi:unnamed protein product [Toxocara canis]|uniref:Poly [ADP-ribose] polymerase n=1 Tax=Toxocara canis TaxID=6265 RepID=A0A183UJ40_TOXCA|nr:unnamed protein product [Toxocara canis]